MSSTIIHVYTLYALDNQSCVYCFLACHLIKIIKKVLKMYKIADNVCNFLETSTYVYVENCPYS